MADTKISALPVATLPLVGTEVLPIVQSGTTDKVAVQDLNPQNVKSNATTGRMQIAGPTAGATSVMTIPNANFTVARTDAEQTFTSTVAGYTTQITNTLGAGTGNGLYVQTRFNVTGNYIAKFVTNSGANSVLTVEGNANVTVDTGNLVIGTSGKGIDFSATSGTGTSELLADYEEGTWTPSIANSFNNYVHTIQVGRYTKVGNLVTVEFTIAWTTTNAGGFSFVIDGLPFTPVTLTNYASGGGIGKIDRLTTIKQVMCQIESATASIEFYELNTAAVATALPSASWNTAGLANLVSGTVTYQA